MKRALLVGAAASLALVPSVGQAQRKAAAQASSPIKFSLSAGLAMPTGDAGDVTGTGINVQAAGTKKLASAPVWLRGEVAYNRFGAKDQGNFFGSDIESRLSTLSGGLDIGYSFVTASTMKPYVLGGLGMYRNELTMEVDNESASESETDLGINFGGGMKFRMGGRMAFVEARYHTAGDIDYMPLTFGIEF